MASGGDLVVVARDLDAAEVALVGRQPVSDETSALGLVAAAGGAAGDHQLHHQLARF